MTAEERKGLKRLIDEKVRHKVQDGYLDCDPESLTIRAMEAEQMGFQEVADTLRKFRDEIVNVLIGEGWDLNRIEMAALNWSKKER